MGDVTPILADIDQGNPQAADHLLALVYLGLAGSVWVI